MEFSAGAQLPQDPIQGHPVIQQPREDESVHYPGAQGKPTL
jgi:hypothetical protein